LFEGIQCGLYPKLDYRMAELELVIAKSTQQISFTNWTPKLVGSPIGGISLFLKQEKPSHDSN